MGKVQGQSKHLSLGARHGIHPRLEKAPKLSTEKFPKIKQQHVRVKQLKEGL